MTRVISEYSNGVTAENYEPNINEEFQMISKIAYQIIREVIANNPLNVFSKVPVANGDTIEMAIIKLIESQGYDASGAGALTRDTTEKMAVRYFNDWTPKKYKTTISIKDLRKTLLAGSDTAEYTTKMVSVLSQSDIYDKFLDLKGLFNFGSTPDAETNTLFKNVGKVTKVETQRDYKGVLRKIKDTVKGMTFVNTDFNTGGILRATDINDIYIIMDYRLKNAIDVEELAGIFNLSKAEISNKIIEIDSDDSIVYIVDQNSILDITRLYELADQKNADGLFWNYFLHTERMYAISQLFDGTFFEVE